MRLGLGKSPAKYEDILYLTGPYIFNKLSEKLTFLATFLLFSRFKNRLQPHHRAL
jgi:hypothetical protein